MEAVIDFIFFGSKIIMNGDCSHEIKRHLLLGRKPRQHTKKKKHYFSDKRLYGQSYAFSVVMYR